MKRLLSIFVFCCFLVILAFLLFGGMEQWIEEHLSSEQSRLTYTILSFFALSADILLPVPSSLVMILNGKILGFYAGTLLSLVSGLVSSSVGFLAGRKAVPYFDKFFSKQDKEISNRLFQRFGNTAITISKALPILSEAISFVAGTTTIAFKSFLLYSFIGHLIVSLTYAYVGSFLNAINSSVITVVVILATLLLSWVFQLLIIKERRVSG